MFKTRRFEAFAEKCALKMRVGALFSAQWRQDNRLKLRVLGGEISLTLREGQTERGGQVGVRKVRVHFTCVRPNKSKTLPR